MTVKIDRIRQRLTALAAIGRSTSGGITRLSYTPEYRQAMELVEGFMREAGMTIALDPVGNIIGRYPGRNPNLPAVLTGSHLDTVPDGGAFDGAVGLIGAIECVQAWHDSGFVPARTVEVIATVEEEGTQYGLLFGSRAMAGMLTAVNPEQLCNREGRSLATALSQSGLDPAAIGAAARDPEFVRCFVELHIEQGGDLEEHGVPCGIVTDIVGIDRRKITIEGKANHAGTTRMDRRKDALVAASRFVETMYYAAKTSDGRYVATVGTMSVYPNAVNVVPGKAEFFFEIRFITRADFEEADACAEACLRTVEKEYGVTATATHMSYTEPVKIDAGVRVVLTEAAGEMGIACRAIPSWAGHDAQTMAKVVPVGMIFVPSIGGISHSPQEATDWEDIVAGVKVLHVALGKLANGE